jgi:hypothetical protein
MPDFERAARAALVLLLCTLATGCGEPPSKEMHQAQGAIDAARAAGADVYAADEYAAATEALKHAEDAVTQRDYRLALNYALDSRERAQNAAREAATARAQARSTAERMLAEVTAALAAAGTRLDEAHEKRVPARLLAPPQETIASVQRAVQEAGTALGREDYLGAERALRDQAARVRTATAEIDQILATHPSRPSRRGR